VANIRPPVNPEQREFTARTARWVPANNYCRRMASKIITAEQLEEMTPAERQAAFDASIVTNLDDAPPELLARTRRRVEELIIDSESTPR
jgi:hypothetical protein